MGKRHEDSAGYNRRKRRSGTSPLRDAHPAATGNAVIVRQMTPAQLRNYHRTGEWPASPDVPMVETLDDAPPPTVQREAWNSGRRPSRPPTDPRRPDAPGQLG